jgi:membrane protein insertase Oxa1/YidC/SpoIIIJ
MTGLQGIPKGAKPLWEFITWAENNKVTVLATYPNLARNEKYSSVENQRIANQITRIYQTHKIKPLGSAEEAMFQQSLYYNTSYHLLLEGVEIRTKKLLTNIKNETIQ